jgi:hypothetical protein
MRRSTEDKPIKPGGDGGGNFRTRTQVGKDGKIAAGTSMLSSESAGAATRTEGSAGAACATTHCEQGAGPPSGEPECCR